jgi:hypothetical protein
MRKSYTKRDAICRFRLYEAHDFHRTSLTCPQIKSLRNRHAAPSLLKDIETSRRLRTPPRITRLPGKGYVIGINDCKQRSRGAQMIRVADSRANGRAMAS